MRGFEFPSGFAAKGRCTITIYSRYEDQIFAASAADTWGFAPL
jgi:hypothetical protein